MLSQTRAATEVRQEAENSGLEKPRTLNVCCCICFPRARLSVGQKINLLFLFKTPFYRTTHAHPFPYFVVLSAVVKHAVGCIRLRRKTAAGPGQGRMREVDRVGRLYGSERERALRMVVRKQWPHAHKHAKRGRGDVRRIVVGDAL